MCVMQERYGNVVVNEEKHEVWYTFSKRWGRNQEIKEGHGKQKRAHHPYVGVEPFDRGPSTPDPESRTSSTYAIDCCLASLSHLRTLGGGGAFGLRTHSGLVSRIY